MAVIALMIPIAVSAGPDLAAPQSAPAPPEAAEPAPNLRIRVLGNRRWCVRMREPVWPNTQLAPPPRRAGGRHAPFITSFGYAYYILALPESEPPVEPSAAAGSGAAQTAPQSAPTAEPLTGPQTQEHLGDLEEETVGAQADFTAPQGAMPEPEGNAADIDIANHPGAIVVLQSPMFRPMAARRFQAPGKPPEVRPYWDPGKTCCSFPNQVTAALPPGRYTLQVSFDVLMRTRGWRHAQLARREGVEIRDGETTELTLRVDSDGYVELKPSGRVVSFEPVEPEAPATAVPTQTAPAPSSSGGGAPRS